MSERTRLAPIPELAKGVASPAPAGAPLRRRSVEPPTEPRLRIAPEADQPPTPGRDEPRAATSRPPARPPKASEQTMRKVSLYLPAELVSRLKERARADDVPQADVLMDALGATRSELTDLVATAESRYHSDGLFMRTAGPRGSGTTMATLPVRLLAPNLQAIDQLVASAKATSRSALCAAALAKYLS